MCMVFTSFADLLGCRMLVDCVFCGACGFAVGSYVILFCGECCLF